MEPGHMKNMAKSALRAFAVRSIERGRAMDLETAVAFALASTDRGGTGLENQ